MVRCGHRRYLGYLGAMMLVGLGLCVAGVIIVNLASAS